MDRENNFKDNFKDGSFQLYNNWIFSHDKYKNWKDIGDFASKELFEQFTDIVERLFKKGKITSEERRGLYDCPYHDFDALINFLDNTPNIKIMVGDRNICSRSHKK